MWYVHKSFSIRAGGTGCWVEAKYPVAVPYRQRLTSPSSQGSEIDPQIALILRRDADKTRQDGPTRDAELLLDLVPASRCYAEFPETTGIEIAW